MTRRPLLPVLRRRTGATSLAVGAVLAGVLTGCTGTVGSDTRTAMESVEAVPPPAAGTPGVSGPPSEAWQPTRAVTCDVHTCSLTLRTTGPREVRAFGVSLSLDDVTDGVAGLTIGDARVECRANEGVEAGRLTLFCDDVTADGVALTAEVG